MRVEQLDLLACRSNILDNLRRGEVEWICWGGCEPAHFDWPIAPYGPGACQGLGLDEGG